MGFEQSLHFGQAGESVIARYLRSRGSAVMPAYEKLFDNGKGPRVFMPQGDLVSPDFLTWRGDRAIWIEAKHKTAFTMHRITGNWVTGIDLHHYMHYCQIEDTSPWPVWLLFLHRGGQAKDSPAESPAGLFGNSLKHLRENENHRHSNHGRSGMVYWAVDDLRHLATLDQVDEAAA